MRSVRIRFVPDDRQVLFFQWMENIRDWCISRQLWWGHRIPAWHCRNCKQIIVARETPATCPHCHSTELVQDTDVLDTWFSSGLWPFSTLGWPDDTADLKAFYPTSLLITGFDILFFWVSRMIMLGMEMTGDVPFREIHMHGLGRDADRQKMSKTKGNVVDPLDIIDRYGTDALRVALLISAATGADIALKVDRIESARGFANKLWNASRLLFQNMERSGLSGWPAGGGTVAITSPAIEDVWIAERLERATETVNRALEVHRYHEAAQTLWDFAWHEFCDWYLEVKKLRWQPDSGVDEHWRSTLTVYETMLRLLHPVMPFLTEELWQRLVHGTKQQDSAPRSVSLAVYPQPSGAAYDARALQQFGILQKVVTAARELRADHKLDPKATLPATIYQYGECLTPDDVAVIGAICRLNVTQRPASGQDRKGAVRRSTPEFELEISVPEQADASANAAELRARLEKENAQLLKVIESSERQLANDAFVSKAKPEVVDEMRRKLTAYKAQLEKNRKLLEGLG